MFILRACYFESLFSCYVNIIIQVQKKYIIRAIMICKLLCTLILEGFGVNIAQLPSCVQKYVQMSSNSHHGVTSVLIKRQTEINRMKIYINKRMAKKLFLYCMYMHEYHTSWV